MKNIISRGAKEVNYSLLLFCYALIILSSCSNKENNSEDLINWFEYKKKELLSMDLDQIDSVVGGENHQYINYKEKSNYTFLKYYKDGNVICEAVYSGKDTSQLHVCSYYDTQSRFEFRQEIVGSGTIRFEGFFFNGYRCGHFKNHDYDGNLRQEGLSFKSNKVGYLKFYSEDGLLEESYKVSKSINGKDMNYIDSIWSRIRN
ncbi:hypothetical protein GYB22_07120 [bacterium]|nr:hypothetical protein [bacterium]